MTKFNTYHDLPNSELLRKYGYVDMIDLPESIVSRLAALDDNIWLFGNPNDEAIISGDEVLDAVRRGNQAALDYTERIDWWLEQGLDE